MRIIHIIHTITVIILAIWEIFIKSSIDNSSFESISLGISLAEIGILLGSIYFFSFDEKVNKLKTYEALVSGDNFFRYLQLWSLMFLIDLEIIHPWGTILFLAIVIALKFYCLWVIRRDYSINRIAFSPIIIAHIILILFLYSWGKSTFVQHYGNEVIGSYFEKPEYKAKYYVRIKGSDNQSEMKVPAMIHVFSESYEDAIGESTRHFSQKHMMLVSVFFDDGSILHFEDCDLNSSEYVGCFDQNGQYWQVGLTNEKL